jgi:integrase
VRDKISFTEEAIETLTLGIDPDTHKEETDVWVWDLQRSGLGVRMRAGKTTSKTYYVQYQYGGRDRRIPLGSTTTYTLQDAQHRAYEIRRDAADGKNPEAAKATRSTINPTFSTIATEFIAARAAKVRPNTLRGYKRYLGTPAAAANEDPNPYFGDLLKLEFKTITKGQIVKCLDAIELPSARADARGALILLYKWAQLKDYVPEGHNPPLYTEDPYPRSEMEETGRALTDDELVAVWKAAATPSSEHNDLDFGRIVRLALLLGNRRQEIGGMKWSEITNGVWHLPAERTKTNFDREIILPATALQIIGEQPPGREYVFGANDKGFSNWSKCKAKFDERVFGRVASFKLHDLRRTMRTGLDRLGISEELAEATIGHVSKKLIRTYNKHNKVSERADATNKWAAYIDGLVSGKITALPVAA